ncbi:MAG: hypothetical protein ABJA79_05470 [Parafilimonas sp.]
MYLVFFSWLITRIKFFRASGLIKRWLIGLFCLKIIAGLAYGWFYSLPKYSATSDTWFFFSEGCKETDWLLRDPLGFIKDLFHYGYAESGNIFSGENSYWNDLKSNVIIKLIAVFNVFTGKNYWANIIFFNFIFFFGPVAFYRLLSKKIDANKILLIAAVFCIPSFLFWYSGGHKDGIIFAAFAMLIYYFNYLFEEKKINVLLLLKIALCLLILFALRNYLIILLAPALLVWYLCDAYPQKRFVIITTVYSICIASFFLSSFLNFNLNVPEYIIERRNEFKALGGNSQLSLPVLQPTFFSFIQYFPYAVDIAFLRPHINEIRNLAYIPAIAENILLWTILIFILFKMIFKNKKDSSASSYKAPGVIIFCYCFAISLLFLSGFTVTLTGAIVRYRAFVLPLLFAPLMSFFKLRFKK